MIQWFHSLGGQQNGPVAESVVVSLITSGQLKREDKVWHSGLVDWVRVDQVPNLAMHIPGYDTGSAPPAVIPVQMSGGNTTPYQTPSSSWQVNPAAEMPPTYMALSVILTVVNLMICCLPIAVIAIIFSAQVSSKYNAGDYQGAVNASNNAKVCVIIFGVLMVLPILFFGFAMVMSISNSV